MDEATAQIIQGSMGDDDDPVLSLRKKVTTKQPIWDDFSSFLENSLLADVTVTCGDRTWMLHKIVICHRCLWFRKALLGSFKEASTSTVNIQEWEADQISRLVKFIYKGHMQDLESLFQNKLAVHKTCLELFKLGDFFQMQPLMDAACLQLQKHLLKIGAEYQRSRSRDSTHEMEEDYLKQYFAQAKIAFDNPSETWNKLRKTFTMLFEYTRYLPLEDRSVHQFLSGNPELGTVVLSNLFIYEGIRFCNLQLPMECRGCDRDVLTDTRYRLFTLTYTNEDGMLVGFCDECSANDKHQAIIRR